ncbi:MAG: hypothetical protein EPN66_14515 [Rhodanobacter sp.]|nr:MAG: hypothetical protein EPN66_14515 [Rhodanobacter sp.]
MILDFIEPASGMVDPSSMLGHLMQSLPGLVKLANVFASLAGVAITIYGVFKFTDVRPRGQTRLITPVLWILVGSALYNLGSSLQTVLGTFFGGSADVHNLLAYQGSELPAASRELVKALIAAARLFGLWAAIRGLMVLRHAGDPNYQRENVLKTGGMRLVFGCLLLNIVQTLNVLANTFGLGHPLS